MILYFADRKMNILGYATTQLKSTYLIVDDKKTEEVESGTSSFECEVSWASKDRLKLETMMDAGNYILRSNGNEKDFFTIIESNINTSKQTISVYAEDAGMDLLNEVAMPFTSDKAYDIAHYIGLYAIDTGFEIGINEIPNLTRKLSWDGETTCTERIASIATQFDNAEISYSFETKGLLITHKYINIFKKRGKDTGEQLRLGYEIASITTNKSVANLATSLHVTGGIPDGKEEPITLKGYKYDDGDFYVWGSRLSSRKALAIWSRYVWDKEPNKLNGYTGHIVQAYSYDTTSQQELCAHAITKLKKLCQMEVNYEADIVYLPENVKIGDRVNIVDNEGRLYTSTRVLRLETSVTSRKRTATLGEYLIKDSGISEKVRDLARQFAESTASVSRANIKAEAARAAADAAKAQAEAAEDVSNAAKETAEGAKSTADSALASANEAQNTANAARDAAGEVTEKVTGIVKTVDDAKTAADNAWKAASTAQKDAATAKTSAANAEKNAADAKTAADAAGTKSEEAISTAEKAQSDATEAKTNATKASETAAAAKEDAATAQKEIDKLGENITTLTETMKVDYARKTELTEAEASLQAQIKKNATEISSTVSKVEKIDETANNAAGLAATAQSKAADAKAAAEQAAQEATAAQTKANEASLAAQTAQSNADTAKAAAKNAQSVADKAKTDLAEAQKNLDTVKGRVDATEGDIAKAQKAVTTAQAAAEKAQSDANAAATKASSAQDVADAAKANASLAQTAANQASAKAEAAQTIANEAKVNASDAQEKAADAVKTAGDAKTAANNAAQTASDAQDVANAAKANATAAQAAADDAKKKSDQAAADLVTAKKNLEEVSGRVDSTAEEVEAAKTAVATAQAAADKAKADAATAQSTANTAKTNASNAQKAADTAKTAADNAQKAADDAQKVADKAQDDVNALTKRVVNAETSIKQNSEAIALRATKEEVTTAIGDIKVGGRNLLLNSNFLNGTFGWNTEEHCKIAVGPNSTLNEENAYVLAIANTGTGRAYNNSRIDKYHLAKTQYTLQFKYKTDDSSPVTFRVGVADTGYIIGNITAPADNTWRKFTATYTAPMTGSLTIRITSGTGRILIGVPKLEYGNKATDWTPAPEDFQDDATTKANNALASAKTYADAQIKVTADGINQNVTKKFDDLQIGGRNYAVGTSNEWSEYWMPSAGVNICRDVTKIVVPDTFKKGDVFTTSIEIEWSGFKSSEGTFKLWTQGSSDGTWNKINPFAAHLAYIGTESGSWLFKVTNTWDGEATNYIVGFRCDYSSGTGKIRWRRLKAEAGNKATDWTPAPEDLATADNVNDKLTELRQEVNSNIEQTGEAIKSSVYEKVYLKDDVDTLLSSVNTEVEQTKTSWQVTFNQLVKQLNDYSDGSDAAFDEIRKYIRFEDGNILLGNSSSPLILRIRNDRIQFLQNGYEVAYISDQRMYNTTCEIINQLRIADSAWTVETNSNGDTIVSLIGL